MQALWSSLDKKSVTKYFHNGSKSKIGLMNKVVGKVNLIYIYYHGKKVKRKFSFEFQTQKVQNIKQGDV